MVSQPQPIQQKVQFFAKEQGYCLCSRVGGALRTYEPFTSSFIRSQSQTLIETPIPRAILANAVQQEPWVEQIIEDFDVPF